MSQWKRQLLEGASELFTRGKKTKDTGEGQAKEVELFQQIGRLQMELEWLKKVSAALMPVNNTSWSITTTPPSLSQILQRVLTQLAEGHARQAATAQQKAAPKDG